METVGEKAVGEVSRDVAKLLMSEKPVDEAITNFISKYAGLVIMRDNLLDEMMKLQYHIPSSNRRAKEFLAKIMGILRGDTGNNH